MGFDPKRHIMKLKGKDYLPVAARLVWFRDEHPDWGIVTTPVEINMEKQYAIFSASIFNGEGKLMATATKMENVGGFGDFIEKAETGSVGRALAYCGYGTQFAPELEEGSRFADAPYGGGGGNFNTSSNRFQNGGNNGPRPAGNDGGGNGYRQNGNNGGPRPTNNDGGNGGGNNFGNGPYTNNAPRPNDSNGNRPMPAAPQRPAPAQAARRDDDFGGDDGEGDLEAPPARPVVAAAARPAPVAPPTQAPAANSGGVTRVREPEQDYGDPGGDDEEDEDPFADEDEAPAKPAPVSARANGASQPGRPAQKAAPLVDEDGDDDGGPIAPPPATNKCSAEGCNTTLPPAVISMSTAKYGRPLCVVHQKEATPIIGGNVSVGAGAARPRAKAGAASGGDGGLL